MPEDALQEVGSIALAVLTAVVIAVVVTAVVALIIRSIGKRKTWARLLIRRVRIPFRVLLLTIAVWAALAATVSGDTWPGLVDRIFQIATIGAATIAAGMRASGSTSPLSYRGSVGCGRDRRPADRRVCPDDRRR